MSDPFHLSDLGPDRVPLVTIALKHCLFPDAATVALFRGAIFPTIRDQRNRITVEERDGREVMLDDNVTPRWAILWAHGQRPSPSRHAGWTVAHIWPASKDPDAYTHLANLCLMPEYFGSLSDKEGPLCAYLRYHAWDCYGWTHGGEPPHRPEGYEQLTFRYLPPVADPARFVANEVVRLDNQRLRLLRPLMVPRMAQWTSH